MFITAKIIMLVNSKIHNPKMRMCKKIIYLDTTKINFFFKKLLFWKDIVDCMYEQLPQIGKLFVKITYKC